MLDRGTILADTARILEVDLDELDPAASLVDQGLDYYELKSMARASLEYSFLPGQSLWSDYALGEVASECAPAPGDTPVTQPPSAACTTFCCSAP